MNIDYNAVIEILKNFLNNEKIEILGISVGEERQVREAMKNLLVAYEKEKETSHYIQSQLDIANAKLVEEKEKNKRYEKYLKSKDKQHEQVLEYLETEKENEYISKEKIKERIKEYYEYDKRMQNKPDWHTTKYYEAKALEKLLEE